MPNIVNTNLVRAMYWLCHNKQSKTLISSTIPIAAPPFILIDRSYVFWVAVGYSTYTGADYALFDIDFADDRLFFSQRVVSFVSRKFFDGVDDVHSFGNFTKYRMLEIQPIGSVLFGHNKKL